MSPLSKTYWKSAVTELKSVKTLVLASIFIALQIAMTSLYIPIPAMGTQKIFFSFLVVSLGSFIYGPIVGIATGAIADLLGFLIHPQGAYFFGYTITAMITAFMYGLFLYKSKITVFRLIICKFCVNMLINVPLNGLWDSILIGKGYFVLLVSRIPKNLLMLPIEILLLYIVFRRVIPILQKEKIISYAPFDKKIKWF
ncbi:MAG: folate family ECF transporter S component [Clostridia bacterium]